MDELSRNLSFEALENDDPIGAETLRRIYKLDNLNRWMWSRIDGWIGERVMEAGCGTGTMTEFLLSRSYVCCVDLNAKHLERLKENLGSSGKLETFQSDLQDIRLRELADRKIDTIVCLNVLEHIENQEITLDHFRSILPSGGRLILLVPAYRRLFGTLDSALSHHRRYDRKELTGLLEAHGFNLIHHRYLNSFGILGWWLNGKVLKRELLPSGQLNLYNRLVPFFMKIEDWTGPPCGLSHVVCAEKVD